MSREAVVAYSQIERETPFNGPGVLHKQAGVIHIGLYGKRCVINEHVDRHRIVELFLNALIHGVVIRVQSASYLKPRLEIVCSSPAALVVGGASRELPYPRGVYESKRCGTSFRR